VISSNLEVGTANLFVDTTTSNVGINTNTPGYTLDVTGDIHLSGNLYQGGEAFEAGLWSSGVSSNIYYTGGKVGIGLTNPVATLDIVGPMRLGDGLSNVVDFSIVTIPTIGDHIWQAELVHPSPAASDWFGHSVSISGDGLYALIGAYGDDTGATDAGSAQVFKRTGTSWAWQAELVHPSPASSDNFGASVSISGDGLYALVGVRYDDTGGTDAGSAQVFKRTGTSWAWQAELVHPSPASSDYFSWSVSISGDGLYALVGVYLDDTGGSGAGSAQVYVRAGTSWAWQAELVHPSPASSDNFGYSVSISGDGLYALVGAYGDDTGGSNAGSAQVYVRAGTSWAWQAELVHPTPAGNDYFGRSVSISGDGLYALVGAYADDTGASDAGSAQVYVGVPGDGGISELVVSTPIKADGTLLSFTGQHICFPEGRMSQGLVVSANQNKYMSLNGPVTMGLGAIKSSESLPVVSLSNVANDRSVFGVVDRFEGGGTERTQTIGIGKVSSAKEVGDNRVIVNSIGEGALWVANTNGNLVSGDYLTTSSLPGYAQKQDSDSLKNSTVAKITMACDFSPEDIPVQIIKKKDNGDNDLDPYGRFQWVDTEKTQKAYKVRYLTSDGKGTDQSNAVHILAYVGCTYHCG